MDGTIYNKERIFDCTLDLLQYIKQSGGRCVFITNNSSKSVQNYVKKVSDIGIEATAENFLHPHKLQYCI